MNDVVFSRVGYHDCAALQLENDAVRVIVTPAAGAKIVSLVDKRAGREWLVTPEASNPFRAWPYGTEYNPNQCGGWDEMFPTILACGYPVPGAYQGVALPDHGELWTLPWQESAGAAAAIALEVTGRALPYRLLRTLSLTEQGVLLDYALEVQAGEPVAFLWAAHPQFACDPGAQIVLPAKVAEVVNVLPLEWGPEFGPAGTVNPWPVIESSAGVVQQDRVNGPEKRGGRKFYLPPSQPISWGELRQPSGEWLRMSWDSQFAPYCGVWIDEGFLNKVPDMAFEPTTGYYDNLAAAWANGRVATAGSGNALRWRVEVQLGPAPIKAGSGERGESK